MDTSLINHQSHAPCHSFLMMFLIQEGYDNHRLRDLVTEAATQKCSYVKVFWKYAVNLQENTHAKVRFQ